MAPSLPKFAKNAMKFMRNRSKDEEVATPDDVLPWGSDQKLETLDVTKMSLRIPVNWRVSAHDFEIKRNFCDMTDFEKHRKKQVFRVYGLPSLRFSLNLYFSEVDGEYSVRAMSEYVEAAMSVDLRYAFVTRGQKAYYLATSTDFNMDTVPLTDKDFKKYSNCLSQWGYVTVHCMVRIDAEVSSRLIRAVTEDKSTRIDIECEVGRKSNSILDEDIIGIVLGSSIESFMRDHIYSGDIKDLNMDIATKLIEHGSKIGAPQLAALCVDYLKKNLSASNVLDVIKLAQMNRIDSLKDLCVQFLHEKCKAVPS